MARSKPLDGIPVAFTLLPFCALSAGLVGDGCVWAGLVVGAGGGGGMGRVVGGGGGVSDVAAVVVPLSSDGSSLR